MGPVDIREVDPRQAQVAALLDTHLAFAREVTPPGHVHALDVDGLLGDGVTLFGLRVGDELLAIGALRELDPFHGEIKSMHTSKPARGRGLGRAMLEHLITEARRRGYRRLSLETGSMPAFAAARRLYERRGFVVTEPFADYLPVPNSVCMTASLAEID